VRSKDFIISSSATTGALWGALLEVIVAFACIGLWLVIKGFMPCPITEEAHGLP
jgi:hypothetical protein